MAVRSIKSEAKKCVPCRAGSWCVRAPALAPVLCAPAGQCLRLARLFLGCFRLGDPATRHVSSVPQGACGLWACGQVAQRSGTKRKRVAKFGCSGRPAFRPSRCSPIGRRTPAFPRDAANRRGRDCAIASSSPDLACRFASVSKLCKSASESDLVWRHLCKACFPAAVIRHAKPGTSWRAFFKSRCVVQKWTLNGAVWSRSAVVVRIIPRRVQPSHGHQNGSILAVSASAS